MNSQLFYLGDKYYQISEDISSSSYLIFYRDEFLIVSYVTVYLDTRLESDIGFYFPLLNLKQ